MKQNIVMLKKILFLTAFFALSIIGLRAQTNAEARKVLDQTAAVLSHRGGATASFQLSNRRLGTLSGTLSIKGNKFLARTSKATVWFNGRTQWSYLAATNEVNISNPTPAQISAMNPYTFIHLYKSGYTLSMKRVGSNYRVHLQAQKSTAVISELYILVNAATYRPREVKMKRNGEWTVITVSNLQQRKLSDALFTFNAKEFPTAEVIDLR